MQKLRSYGIDCLVALVGTVAAVLFRAALDRSLGNFRPFVTLSPGTRDRGPNPEGVLLMPEPSKASTCRILIVDDNMDATAGLSMMLQHFGHDTRVASDGQQAIQQAELFRPQVVLLDIGLPLKNGYEVAQHIRSQPWGSDIILIALTGWGQDDDKQRAREAGFNHHMSKPVKSSDLQRFIVSLLQQVTAVTR